MAARDAAELSRAAMASVLGALPVAGFRWRREASEEIALGRLPGGGTDFTYAGFLDGIETADAARIAAAVEDLKRVGTAFTASVSAPGGATYEIEGRRTPSGDSVMWLADVSAIRRAEAARAAAVAEAAALRAMLDALPMPVWRRDPDLRVVDCNNAYAAALDLPRAAVLAQACELAPENGRDRTLALARAAAAGTVQSERCHVVIAGSRRLLEFSEAPDRSGGTIGVAIDHTDLESAEGELARHVNAHGQVLESIHAAVAIYGADKRLNFFNSAFARLWGIEEDWLAGEPSLDELLERLRERRRVPEYADFRAFKRQQLEMFTSLIEPQTELMHRPDDRTLSVSVSPHPLGRADLCLRGCHRPPGARTLVQHPDRGSARDARQSVRGHRRVRRRRPAQAAQSGLSHDLGVDRKRPCRRAACRRHRREDPGFLRRRRRLAGDARADHRRGHGADACERPARPARRVGAAARDGSPARRQCVVDLPRCHRHRSRRARAARAQRGAGNRRTVEERIPRQCFL